MTSVANFCVTAPLLYDYVRSIVGRLYFKDLLTCAIYLHWSNPLRSVHTERQVSATCRGDTLQRQIAWCVPGVCTGGFLWKSLSLQQVVQIQSDLIFCDLLQRQNSVAETTIFTKNYPVHTRRFVAATCRLTVLLQLVARPVHMEWSVAATSCCNVCNLSPSVYRPLRTRKWSRPSGSPG